MKVFLIFYLTNLIYIVILYTNGGNKMKREGVSPLETFKEFQSWYDKNADTLELNREYLFEYFRPWIAGFQYGYGVGFEHGEKSGEIKKKTPKEEVYENTKTL